MPALPPKPVEVVAEGNVDLGEHRGVGPTGESFFVLPLVNNPAAGRKVWKASDLCASVLVLDVRPGRFLDRLERSSCGIARGYFLARVRCKPCRPIRPPRARRLLRLRDPFL